MNYLTAKEQRVEKAWGKRGLIGLRSDLLLFTELYEIDNDDLQSVEKFVTSITRIVYNVLPSRLWKDAERLVGETCGLKNVDINDWREVLMQAHISEETLREDLGDE